MKKIYLLFIVFLLSIQTYAQHAWDSFSGSPMNSTVKTIVADTGNSFYVGGYFTEIGSDSVAGIAYWDGSSYSTIGKPGLSNAQILSMLKFDGALIAAGTFNYIDTTPCNNIAYWDGSRWRPMSSGLEYTGATTVSTLAIFEDELYAGGTFTFTGLDTVNNVARWTGQEWAPLGSGVNGKVNSMCVFDGELYVAGSFTNAGGLTVKNIARWDGTDWDYVDTGLEYTGATTVSTLRVFNDSLYAGGNFVVGVDSTEGFISRWDGTDWSDVGGGLEYTGATTVSTIYMYEYDKKLIVEAKYAIGGDYNDIIYAMQTWNDTTWSAMAANTDQAVYALESVNGILYAGGDFTQIDDLTTSFIARWEETKRYIAPSFIASSESIAAIRYAVYPNPVINELNIITDNKNLLSAFKFILTDLTGRQILEIENATGKINFDRASIRTGVYLYQIITENGKISQQGKLLFE